VEHCFDLWLLEEADEVDVLGLPFRARIDLPCPADSGEGAYPAPPMQTDGRWTAVRYDVADPDQQADPRVVPAPQCEELETAASSDEAGDTASPPSGATAGSRNGVTARVSSGEHDVTEESKMS